MNRIGLKINGIWCVLPQDVSISIEEQNPLFSDSGSFSYPIEMSISQNRELFKSIDSPQGRIRLNDLDGLPFELWFDGTMLLYGSTETDDDIDIEEDRFSINLVSGNGDLQSKIEGLKCTDVPLMGKVLLGHSYDEYIVYIGDPQRGKDYRYDLDSDYTMNYNVNVSEPYSAGYPYCNVRICSKRTDDYDKKKDAPYWVYEADRPWSGPCFYVAYFLDCLFAHLGMIVKENNLPKVGDMMRLAFFTTKCKYEVGESTEVTSIDNMKNYMRLSINHGNVKWSNSRFVKKEILATSENFPDTDVSSVINSLFNAFGVRIVNDSVKNEVGIYYMRDILKDTEVVDVDMLVRDVSLSYEKVHGVKLTYGGDEDNTAFNYTGWDGRIVHFDDYKQVIKRIGPYDKNCYIGMKTGNKYRVKIDSESEEEGNVKELNPSLFEVAQFQDFIMGEDGESVHELKIDFTPIIENDVTGAYANKSDKVNSQVLAIYIEAEMTKPIFIPEGTVNALVTVTEKTGVYDESRGEYSGPYIRVWYQKVFNYDKTSNKESPLQTHDSGFTLGIMRGPGNGSGVDVMIEDYDGNGNDAWVTVEDDYAFTSDTMDAYGNRYDYNGVSEGGIASQSDSISLKTHVQTAEDVGLNDDWKIDAVAAKRGLVDRFMSEYMYFLLHRKTVSMDVDTTLSNLTSLSWFKQLRINGTVGRLRSRSYTLTNSGVSDMGIKLYTIN